MHVQKQLNTADQTATKAFDAAAIGKRKPHEFAIDLDKKDSLTGSLLIARPGLSLTLDENDEEPIHSPIFFVADEIDVDGEAALVMVMINAPQGDPDRLGDVRGDILSQYKKKTIFHGGNFGHRSEDGSLKIQLLVPTNDYWLRSMPAHPYHGKDKRPDFMVVDCPHAQDAILKYGWAYNFLVTSGYCILPKGEMADFLAYCDFYVSPTPSAEAVFSDHAASKYLTAFRDIGLQAGEIHKTQEWAQQMRSTPYRPH